MTKLISKKNMNQKIKLNNLNTHLLKMIVIIIKILSLILRYNIRAKVTYFLIKIFFRYI